MRRIYRFLLRRLPPAFLALYGTEMEEAFLESLAIARRRWRILAAPYSLARAAWDLQSSRARFEATSVSQQETRT